MNIFGFLNFFLNDLTPQTYLGVHQQWFEMRFFSTVTHAWVTAVLTTAISVISVKMKEYVASQFNAFLAFFTKNCCLFCSTE